WYASCPGLKVLAPYSSEDDRGLLKAAIRDPDPVVFLENELFYEESFPVSEEVLDSNFFLPIGKAKIEREGKDVNITAFSRMVGYALKLRLLKRKESVLSPLDRAIINASVRKTSRLVIVEDGFPQHGVGSEIWLHFSPSPKHLPIYASLYFCSTSVIEESFYYLDAPVERITGADVPVSYNAGLERMSLPQVCVTGFSLFCMMIFICTCNIRIYVLSPLNLNLISSLHACGAFSRI
ncbi:pyruvate dehydrogenase e1 component subunit beta, partial [Quercus suber]